LAALLHRQFSRSALESLCEVPYIELQVQSALEAAGFSRSNPYNIVQQGKISKMSQLSDAERLNLLKEIGGASLYEVKRSESYKTMMSQKEQLADVDDTVRIVSRCYPVNNHNGICRMLIFRL
jgi:chromosome segregation ATPase